MLGAVVCGVLKGRSNHVLRLGRAISDSSNQAYLRRGCFAPMLRKPWHPIHRITFDRALGICRLSQHGTQVPASGFRRFPFSQVLLFRVPGFRFSLFPVPGSRVPLFSLSCSGFQVPGSRFRCSGFHHRLPATGHRLISRIPRSGPRGGRLRGPRRGIPSHPRFAGRCRGQSWPRPCRRRSRRRRSPAPRARPGWRRPA